MAWACSYAQGLRVYLKIVSTWKKNNPFDFTGRLISEMTWQQGKSEISMDWGPHLAVFTLAKFPLALLTMLVE